MLKQKRKEPMNFDCYRILAHPSNRTRRDYTESVPAGEEEHRRAATYSRVIMDGRTNGGGNNTPKGKDTKSEPKKKTRTKKEEEETNSQVTNRRDRFAPGGSYLFFSYEGNCQGKITR